MGQSASDYVPTLSAMDPTAKMAQYLQKRPNIQGTILRFPAPFQLVDFFLIPNLSC